MVVASRNQHNQPVIKKDMRVADIIAVCPEAEGVVGEYGLHCFNCVANEFETLEEGCLSHGFDEEDIDSLVEDLNDLLRARPDKPQVLTLTLDAARAIKGIAKDEGKADHSLAVIADGQGSFCMEFQQETAATDQAFWHREEPSVRILASTLTLSRIGGATIDFREGRFKLDLAEDLKKTPCACGGSCSCKKT